MNSKFSLKAASLLFGFFISMNLNASAQTKDHDLQLWTSISLKHKFTSRTSFSVELQERQNRNLSTRDSWFVDAALDHKFSGLFSASLNYRYISKNEIEYNSSRHRVYTDLKFRVKSRRWVFNLRERLQGQIEDYYSSETGKTPEYFSRTKLKVSYDPIKKYTPYLGCEVYYSLHIPGENNTGLTRFRYEAGLDYEFNLLHSINIYSIYQQNLQEFTDEIIGAIGYTYSF